MDENHGMTSTAMTSTATTSTPRPGGLWAALAIATRDADREAAESRRRLAALRLRHTSVTLADFEPCA
jgi:hypothetical protein